MHDVDSWSNSYNKLNNTWFFQVSLYFRGMALVGYRFFNPLYHSDIVWNLFGSGKVVHELCTKGYAFVRQVSIYRVSQKWRTNGALRCRRDCRKRQKNVKKILLDLFSDLAVFECRT
jgi:hypothetical protein